jgi:hypothetical protein
MSAPPEAGAEPILLKMSELLILALTVLLCLYWFRYNCRAILKTAAASDGARQVASANQLRFAEVLEQLETGPAGELDALNELLLREHEILTCLLRYTAGPRVAGHSVELRLLMVDFRCMQGWYRLTRGLMPGTARRALGECARILTYFAHALGERSAALSRN